MIEEDLDSLPDDVDVDDVKDFNPMESDRPPRMYGYAEETEELFSFLRSRGDQRIGQYLINAIRKEYDTEGKEEVEQRLWNINADDLLQAVKNYESDDEEEDTCMACGDGADSADELQKILEEKGGE